jgi:hypothetical protein
MQATITTWQIGEAYREGEGIVTALREVVRRHQATFRRLGLLDIMLIRSSPETMTVVNMYEDDLDRDAMQAETMRALGPALAGKLELIGREFGPAWDTTDILG